MDIMDIRVITVIKDITDIMVIMDIRNYAECSHGALKIYEAPKLCTVM